MASSSTIPTINYTQTLIPIFDGEAYDFWSIKMKTLFISHDLWDVIEDGIKEATQEEQSKWSATEQKEYKQLIQRDAKALLHLQQAVSNTIFPKIMRVTSAKEAWEILKAQYKGTDKVISIKLQSLWKEFDNLMMKEGESIQMFFSRVSNIINQIKSYGDTIEDKKIVQKILRSLPSKFDYVVAAIEEAKDLDKLTLVELEGSLQAHEERMQKHEPPLEQAFQSKINISQTNGDRKNNHGQNPQTRGSFNYRGRGRRNYKNQGSTKEKSGLYCTLCKKNNHDTKNCRFKCMRCKKHTHLEKDCWYKQKDEANFTEKNQSLDQIFYSAYSSHQESRDIWYIDSGCSNHMTSN